MDVVLSFRGGGGSGVRAAVVALDAVEDAVEVDVDHTLPGLARCLPRVSRSATARPMPEPLVSATRTSVPIVRTILSLLRVAEALRGGRIVPTSRIG
jgi:hypothetical protein